ncbi:glycosyltransferase family 2 protein [Spiribacter salilacus]|uniref:glycosyltransferase family 2 protein n=1 Tax=Spiribacter salilacus TaxID=2664894 RepID=UPI001C12BA97|nr:glycosyltransferase family 2 protein [Spiribacter salilacus]
MLGKIKFTQQAGIVTINQPLISIITVTYNAQTHIREAIESVLSQTYPNVEYIIIDGVSTDGTLDIIRGYEDAIDHWISEPDEGIYNAMNKGISLASGDIIGLVNADDVIYPDTLERVAAALSENPTAGFTMAPVELAHEDGKVFGVASPLTDDELDTRMWKEMPCPHQGMYVKTEIYESLGLFDERYLLRADYDFLLRLLKADIPFVRLDQPVGFFRSGGQSGGLSTWLETRRLLASHGRPRLASDLSFLSSVLKMTLSEVLPNPLFKQLKRLNCRSKRKLY